MDHKERTIFDTPPFEIVEFDEKVSPRILGPGSKWVQVGPKKYCLPDLYKTYGLDIYNFEVRSDDLTSRSGTTLHCEMIWQIANDLNYEGAKKDIIDYRFPHIDFCFFMDANKFSRVAETNEVDDSIKDTVKKLTKISLEDLAKRKGRRFIKSHLPISLMPPHMFEIIYCARNPKDVLVSLYTGLQFFKFDSNDVDIKAMFEAVKNNLHFNCPYFEHVKEAWARRNDDNFLFLFYEDTIKDKRQTMMKIANFLGKKLSNDQLDSLEDYLSLEKFKNNKSVNCDHLVKLGIANENMSFIRKDEAGGWREYITGDLEKDVNKWMEENLKDTDLKYPGN